MPSSEIASYSPVLRELTVWPGIDGEEGGEERDPAGWLLSIIPEEDTPRDAKLHPLPGLVKMSQIKQKLFKQTKIEYFV